MDSGGSRDRDTGTDDPTRSDYRMAGAVRARGGTSFLELRAVTKLYGDTRAVDGIDLIVEQGEFFTILGPSGSGKSTLLHIIAGLIEPDGGRVLLEGLDVTNVKPYARNLGMVFQSLALFPHMDVFSSIAFPLRMRRMGNKEVARRVKDVLDVVRLHGIESRPVTDLSGGQRQRVAIARALVYEPRLLLLDEPLGALDRRLREDMQLELLRLHHEVDITILNVTHDQREALMLSDRIAVINEGKIEQVADPAKIYFEPQSRFVASFLGDPVCVTGVINRNGGGTWLVFGDCRVKVAADTEDGEAVLVLRSESVCLRRAQSAAGEWDNEVPVTIEFAAFEERGMYYQVRSLELGASIGVFVPRISREQHFAPGDLAWLAWRIDDAPVVVRPLNEGVE